jgi:hypothetical protein
MTVDSDVGLHDMPAYTSDVSRYKLCWTKIVIACLYCMGVKLGLLHCERNLFWGCSRKGAEEEIWV